MSAALSISPQPMSDGDSSPGHWSYAGPIRSTTVVTMTHAAPGGRPELRVVESWPEIRPVYTIKDVADACGLPQPAIAQIVPRTWTEAGWMYTGAQIRSAIDIAHELRGAAAEKATAAPRPRPDWSEGWTPRPGRPDDVNDQ